MKLSRLLARVAKTASLLAFGGVLAGAVLEATVRVFVPQRLVRDPKHLYMLSPTLGYRLAPNFEGTWQTTEYSTPIRTNSLGFRDLEPGEKRADLVRILALGDSFTFSAGTAPEDGYPKVLERLLNASHGPHFQVLNAGVRGYGPEHYLRLLQEVGPRLRPDIVTVGFCVSNDVFDRISHDYAVRDGMLHKTLPAFSARYSLLYPVNNFLEQRSHSFVFFRTRLDSLLWRLGLRPYYFPEVFKTPYDHRTIESWDFTKRTLKEIDATATRLKARLVIVVIPTSYQVHEHIWRQYAAVYRIDPNRVDLSLPQRILREFGDSQRVSVVDLLPKFVEIGAHTPLFFKIDGHWNQDGHRLAAEEIFRHLLANRLVPRSTTEGFAR